MTNNENEMRAKFQAWHSEQVTRLRDHGELGAAKKWEDLKWICEAAWQASRQALVIQLPNRASEAYREEFEDVEGGSFNEAAYIRDVRKAIESQGVKCK